MGWRGVWIVLLGACGFNAPLGSDAGPPDVDARLDAPASDGSIDSALDAPLVTDGNPASVCYGTGLGMVCLADGQVQMGMHDLPATIDTTSCLVNAQTTAGVDVCVVAADKLKVPAGGTVVTGTRPLVIVGATLVDVMGTLTTTAGARECGFGRTPESDFGGGAGGAGGSFAGTGGSGGDGDLDTSVFNDGTAIGGLAGSIEALPRLAGGCNGQSGGAGNTTLMAGTGTAPTGGHGGGAVYLASNVKIQVGGKIIAVGGGGGASNQEAGGGGGGAGGFIGLDAPTVKLTGMGTLTANAGTGGEGAGASFATAKPGLDGTLTTTGAVAPGTSPHTFGDGGDGGNGTGGTTTIGGPGASDNRGGGGGGGGAGFIYVHGNLMMDADVTITPSGSP